MNADLQLKPCPFCGCEPVAHFIPPHDHFIVELPRYEGAGVIECPGCEVVMMAQTLETVIEKWNRRADDADRKDR